MAAREEPREELRERAVLKEEPKEEPVTPQKDPGGCLLLVVSMLMTSAVLTSLSSSAAAFWPVQLCIKDDPDADQPGTWSCPHCGDSVQNLRHFVYRDQIFCEEAADEGETLEKWLMGRGVSRTTVWRLKKKQEEMLVSVSVRLYT